MLKLSSSFSKKVPSNVQFSSVNYHVAVEIELPDGLNENQLKERIHSVFELCRSSVENEIAGKTNGNGQAVPVQVEVEKTAEPKTNGNGKKAVVPASQKQIKYLLDLGKQLGVSIGKMLEKYNVQNANDLDKDSASRLIEELKKSGATA